MSNVYKLAHRKQLTSTDAFIMRQQARYALELLGVSYVSKVLLVEAIDIIASKMEDKDKLKKLQELIENG